MTVEDISKRILVTKRLDAVVDATKKQNMSVTMNKGVSFAVAVFVVALFFVVNRRRIVTKTLTVRSAAWNKQQQGRSLLEDASENMRKQKERGLEYDDLDEYAADTFDDDDILDDEVFEDDYIVEDDDEYSVDVEDDDEPAEKQEDSDGMDGGADVVKDEVFAYDEQSDYGDADQDALGFDGDTMENAEEYLFGDYDPEHNEDMAEDVALRKEEYGDYDPSAPNQLQGDMVEEDKDLYGDYDPSAVQEEGHGYDNAENLLDGENGGMKDGEGMGEQTETTREFYYKGNEQEYFEEDEEGS